MYKPSQGYTGDDVFTYQATDNHGAKSDTGKVSITVLPASKPAPTPTPTPMPNPTPTPTPSPSNHPPTIKDTSATTKQDTAVTIPITVSDPVQGDTGNNQ